MRWASPCPTHDPRATDYVPEMLGIVSQLEGRGLAYRAPSGDVNYAVRRSPATAKLSGKSLDDLQAGERVAVDGGKGDPLDFGSGRPPSPRSRPMPSSTAAPTGAGGPAGTSSARP